MTGTGTNQGNTGADQNALVVSAAGATHPLGAGFAAGSVTTSSSATVTHGWGKPTANAVVAATITGDTTKAAIYGYDTGAAMQGGYTAPARRVAFHLYNGSSSVLNDNSVALFDAVIAWAAKSAPKVSYKRDATDRITERSANGRVVARYSYTGSGDTSDLTLDGSNNVVEATLSLPGGALYSWRSAAPVWSYANTHGDVVVTTDNTGTKQGPTRAYDPYGQPLTTAAEIDNSTGEFDYGWLGEHQRQLEHQTGAIQIIEMGERQYDSMLGRFVEVDPIEGGLETNDYAYVADPVNQTDLDGNGGFGANCGSMKGRKLVSCRNSARRTLSRYRSMKRYCIFGKNRNGGCRGGSIPRMVYWRGLSMALPRAGQLLGGLCPGPSSRFCSSVLGGIGGGYGAHLRYKHCGNGLITCRRRGSDNRARRVAVGFGTANGATMGFLETTWTDVFRAWWSKGR